MDDLYQLLNNEHNYEWISNMTGLNKNKIRKIRDKILNSIGLELVKEITNLETLRLDPLSN